MCVIFWIKLFLSWEQLKLIVRKIEKELTEQLKEPRQSTSEAGMHQRSEKWVPLKLACLRKGPALSLLSCLLNSECAQRHSDLNPGITRSWRRSAGQKQPVGKCTKRPAEPQGQGHGCEHAARQLHSQKERNELQLGGHLCERKKKDFFNHQIWASCLCVKGFVGSKLNGAKSLDKRSHPPAQDACL